MRPRSRRTCFGLLCSLTVGCGGTNAAPPYFFSAADAGLDAPSLTGTFGSVLGPTVQASTPPPPISGGTLLVSHDGTLAIVADPERDRISLVDVAHTSVAAVLALQPGDEPGRAVEDANRRVHVALRSGGSVVTVDLASQTVTERMAVCPLPRGIAYNSQDDTVLVACASGELVTLPASGGAPTRSVYVDQDLRDVLVFNGSVYVTRFREAEVLSIGPDGSVTHRVAAPSTDGTVDTRVAWRSIATADGRIVMVDELEQLGAVDVTPEVQAGSYSGSGVMGGGAIVQPGVTVFGEGDLTSAENGALALNGALPGVVLGVDVALSPDQSRIAVASAGNIAVNGAGINLAVSEFALNMLAEGVFEPAVYNTQAGQVVAVAYLPTGDLLAQTREPAALLWLRSGMTVPLATDSRADTGHTIFHSNPGGGLACASCHPEGMDDGHIWTFNPTGPRRTQSLRGHLLSRAPFHWDGDLHDMGALVTEVFDLRMSGGPLASDQVAALGHWLDTVPALPAPSIPTATADLVAQGRALFNDASVGCAGCHSGPLFTNNALVDVGTGGTFKVPSLLAVSWRAPYLHDGCATTLQDRFTPGGCGGGDRHGHTLQLQSSDLSALIAYLDTL